MLSSRDIFTEPMMHEDTMTQLKQSLRGRLIDRADSRYEEARKLYNGMIDKRPLMIVQCADVTGYILIGIYLEERDLIGLFGDQYRRYRQQVGMLIPLPGRKFVEPPAEQPPSSEPGRY
jgi:hypothetical protein